MTAAADEIPRADGTQLAAASGDIQLAAIEPPRRLFACTPSRLTAWVDCPRRYRMTYLDRPRPKAGPPWAHNSLGASMHNALAGWWRLPRRERTVGAAGNLLDDAWSADGFRDADQAIGWRAHARALVRRYVAVLDADHEPLGVERTVAVKSDPLALSGRIDRLDDRAGELVVVDYKTGRRPLSADDARGSLALALYAIAAAATFRRRCLRVELHHLPTGEVHGFDHTEASLRRQLGRAEQIAAEATHAEQAMRRADTPAAGGELFPPRPGGQCGWCDLRSHCPEGSAAAPAQASWAALGELEPA